MAEAAGAACPAADGKIAGVRAWQQLDLSASAVANKEATLSHYRREVDELKAKAYKKLRDQYTPPEDVFGHIPGVRVGEEFGGRGELAILGLHKRILQGIDGSPTSAFGAAAICLSGGYKDDEDQGTTFWYTGQGGNQGGVQVQDQKWEQGNVALRTSCQTGMPVRVMRGSKLDGAVRYAYDGLYKVKQFRMEPSAHGPLVIKFLMEGISGESAASHKVDYLSMFNRGQHSMLSCRLAASDEEEDEEDVVLGRGKRRRHRPALTAEQEAKKRSAEDRQALRKRRLAEIRAIPGVVMEDVSDGLERIPIPVVNTVNNTPLMPLTYITDYQFAPFMEDLVQPLLDEQNEQMLRYVGGNECGLDFGRMMMAQDRTLPSDNVHKRKDCQNYNHKGLLMLTYPFGVHECCDKCTHKQCQRNKQVSGGISLPLEVFMTEDRGWGVRCATDIKAGQFVACYIGEVITEGMAERRRQKDAYLFNLDHFSILFQEVQNTQCDIPEWHLPPAPPTDAHLRLLARMKDMRPAFEEKVKQAEAVRKAFEEERAQAAAAAAAAACEAAPAGGNGATDQQGKVEGGEPGPQGVGSDVDAVEGDAVCQVSSASAECKDVVSRDAPGDEGAPEAGPSLAAPSQSAGLGSEGAAGSDGAPAAAPSRQQSEPGSNWTIETTREALEDALGEWPDPDPQVLLAVDAMHRGNVARFINHSCEPNLTIQAVFSRKARNVLYFYHGLFASVDIPAHTELTYSYGEQYVPKRLKCQCGAPSCLSNIVPS